MTKRDITELVITGARERYCLSVDEFEHRREQPAPKARRLAVLILRDLGYTRLEVHKAMPYLGPNEAHIQRKAEEDLSTDLIFQTFHRSITQEVKDVLSNHALAPGCGGGGATEHRHRENPGGSAKSGRTLQARSSEQESMRDSVA